MVDLLLGINDGLPGLVLLLSHLLPQRFLLSGFILQLLPQPGQLCLQPGGLFLGVSPFSLTLRKHLRPDRKTRY